MQRDRHYRTVSQIPKLCPSDRIRDDFQLAPGQMIEARPLVILRPKHGIRMTFTNTIAPAHCIA